MFTSGTVRNQVLTHNNDFGPLENKNKMILGYGVVVSYTGNGVQSIRCHDMTLV